MPTKKITMAADEKTRLEAIEARLDHQEWLDGLPETADRLPLVVKAVEQYEKLAAKNPGSAYYAIRHELAVEACYRISHSRAHHVWRKYDGE